MTLRADTRGSRTAFALGGEQAASGARVHVHLLCVLSVRLCVLSVCASRGCLSVSRMPLREPARVVACLQYTRADAAAGLGVRALRLLPLLLPTSLSNH